MNIVNLSRNGWIEFDDHTTRKLENTDFLITKEVYEKLGIDFKDRLLFREVSNSIKEIRELKELNKRQEVEMLNLKSSKTINPEDFEESLKNYEKSKVEINDLKIRLQNQAEEFQKQKVELGNEKINGQMTLSKAESKFLEIEKEFKVFICNEFLSGECLDEPLDFVKKVYNIEKKRSNIVPKTRTKVGFKPEEEASADSEEEGQQSIESIVNPQENPEQYIASSLCVCGSSKMPSSKGCDKCRARTKSKSVNQKIGMPEAWSQIFEENGFRA